MDKEWLGATTHAMAAALATIHEAVKERIGHVSGPIRPADPTMAQRQYWAEVRQLYPFVPGAIDVLAKAVADDIANRTPVRFCRLGVGDPLCEVQLEITGSGIVLRAMLLRERPAAIFRVDYLLEQGRTRRMASGKDES